MDETVNYTKEAFRAPGNLIFLLVVGATATAAGILPMVPLWLLAVVLGMGSGAELLYLGGRSSYAPFRRRVRVEKAKACRERLEPSEVYRQLSRQSQRRYYRLRQFREGIRETERHRTAASPETLDAHLEKIDDLLRSYLDLLYRRERIYGLLRENPEEELQASMQALQDDLADAADRVRSVKERRLSVLDKRQERLRVAREHLAVIGAQLGTIEEEVKYIHEQSWTLLDSEEGAVQIDRLLTEVEETQRSVEEIEKLFSRSTASAADDLAALDAELKAALGESSTEENEADAADNPSF